MRVVNDREERTETAGVGFLSLLTHVLMVSLGMATFILAPMPMIVSHMRLLEPWSKIAIVGGSLVALVVLEVPVSVVVLLFVFGLYASDAINRKCLSVWGLLGSSALIALCTSVLVLFTQAAFEKLDLVVYWNNLVLSMIEQMKQLVQVGASVEWSLIQGLLFYEGPFLVISGALFSLWISLGVCAHAGWLGEKNPYVANSLRKIQPSLLISALFLVMLIGSRFLSGEYHHLFGGFGRVFAALLFVEGTIVLSQWMAKRKIRSPIRTVLYSLFIFLGFYALIGIGFFSPLFMRKKPRNAIKLEEAI